MFLENGLKICFFCVQTIDVASKEFASILVDRLDKNISDTTDIPIGSSRVENHTTWDGLEVLGRQRRIERMA